MGTRSNGGYKDPYNKYCAKSLRKGFPKPSNDLEYNVWKRFRKKIRRKRFIAGSMRTTKI